MGSFSDSSHTVGHSEANHSHSLQHYSMNTEQLSYTAGKTCHRSTLSKLLPTQNRQQAFTHILDRNSAHTTQHLITFSIKIKLGDVHI